MFFDVILSPYGQCFITFETNNCQIVLYRIVLHLYELYCVCYVLVFSHYRWRFGRYGEWFMKIPRNPNATTQWHTVVEKKSRILNNGSASGLCSSPGMPTISGGGLYLCIKARMRTFLPLSWNLPRCVCVGRNIFTRVFLLRRGPFLYPFPCLT